MFGIRKRVPAGEGQVGYFVVASAAIKGKVASRAQVLECLVEHLSYADLTDFLVVEAIKAEQVRRNQ